MAIPESNVKLPIGDKKGDVAEDAADAIHMKLEMMGLADRVSELVKSKLRECGWEEQVTSACRQYFEENSINNFHDLATGITPIAKSMVPDAVKKELLHELKDIIKSVDETSK